MIGYQYTYLVISLLFFIFWSILFLKRKDTRKEMLIISLIFGVIGLFVEPIYITDWWKPLTITGTAVGIEDFLFGFAFGGVASVCYEVSFKERIKIKRKNKKQNFNLFILLGIAGFLFFGSFYIFNFNTFYATLLAFIMPTLVIWLKRKDLIVNSLMSGAISLFISVIVYAVMEYLTPGWIDEFLLFQNIPKIIFLNMPLDDIIWFFLAGLWIGPLYEYWQEGKLIKYKG
ncbi:MAG: lycopene cyclase domain-containing protein [archaeon]